MERRLAAILAADVVGYTRLMGSDEHGTLQRLNELRQGLLEPLIDEHHGRIVNLMGDGLLVEFGSVVDAVACSMAWQDQVVKHESNCDEETKLQFRIGINLGDVIVHDGDIHGDGVNIASRLEGLAQPGGICLSDDAYRQVKGKTEALFEDMGDQDLKNVVEPVRVYRIGVGRPAEERARPNFGTLAFADKPSIAVLPFNNLSSDPEQEYFTDGITEDIITELSRFRALSVVSRTSSFSYKGQNLDVRQVGKKLGARFVVEGSIRRAGGRIRVTGQLVDAATGKQLWAERYDRDIEDLFAVQDELTLAIVASLAIRIEDEGYEAAKRKPPHEMAAYDYWLRGKKCMDLATSEGYDTAQSFFWRCIEIDPDFARAYAGLAEVGYSRSFHHAGDAFIEAIKETKVLADKAVALDDTDAQPHYVLSWVSMFLKQFERAQQQLNLTAALNPNDADLMMHRACILALLGDAVSAVEPAETAIRLNPHHPGWYLEFLTLIRFAARNYEEALAISTKEPDVFPSSPGWRAGSCANLGRMGEAREHGQELVDNLHNIWVGEPPTGPLGYIEFFCKTVPFRRPEDTEHLRRSLMTALNLS